MLYIYTSLHVGWLVYDFFLGRIEYLGKIKTIKLVPSEVGEAEMMVFYRGLRNFAIFPDMMNTNGELLPM